MTHRPYGEENAGLDQMLNAFRMSIEKIAPLISPRLAGA